jgi:hypothetical protein
MAYEVLEFDASGIVLARTPVIGTFVLTFVTVNGGAPIVTPPTGLDSTRSFPQAWPRGV